MMDVEHACKQIDELLPWFINRSLPGKETAQVRAHLADCARCREEAEWLAALGTHLRDVEWKTASPPPFDSLWRRIAGERGRRRPALLALAAGLVLAVAATLGAVLAWQPLAPRYHTVTDVAPPMPATMTVELAFAPDAPVSSLHAVLERHDAVIVEGPDVDGRVRLEFPISGQEDRATLLDTLKRRADVISVAEVPGRRE